MRPVHLVSVALLAMPLGVASAQPALRLSPDTLDFGAVPVGAEVVGEFVLIESVGDEPITIKIHAAFQPYFMPFDLRYRLNEVRDGLIDSRPAVLGLVPVRTGPVSSDVAVDTDERGAYVVQSRAVGTEAVAFSVPSGETASRALELRNPGFAPLSARVDPGASWMDAAPRTLALAPDGGAEVVLTVDASGLAPGVYRDTLRATRDGTPYAYSWRVPVALTVTESTSTAPEPPAAPPLLVVSPTPADGTVRIAYSTEAPATLLVYSARGREVARLGTVAGTGRVGWSPPTTGIYFVWLGTEAGGVSQRILALR